MGIQVSVKVTLAKPLDMKKARKEIQKALEETGEQLKKEFGKTTSEWEGDKPTFVFTTGGSGTGRVWVHCFPSGNKHGVEKWRYLDEGTGPHVIAARNAPMLVFPFQGTGKSYDPGTVRYWLGSMKHRKLGPISYFASVNHPGNEPRDWSIILAEQEKEPFAERLQAAVERALEG